jgi:hypothetical protein
MSARHRVEVDVFVMVTLNTISDPKGPESTVSLATNVKLWADAAPQITATSTTSMQSLSNRFISSSGKEIHICPYQRMALAPPFPPLGEGA